MSRVRSAGVSLLILTIIGGMAGCSSSSSAPPISVTLSPTSSKSIDQIQSLAITAGVTNDSSSRGVTWTLSGPGSLSNSTGFAVTYRSPTTAVTSPQQATVTASSAADATKNAVLQITVNPSPQIPGQTLASGNG